MDLGPCCGGPEQAHLVDSNSLFVRMYKWSEGRKRLGRLLRLAATMVL
jgi:hypothetical protein